MYMPLAMPLSTTAATSIRLLGKIVGSRKHCQGGIAASQ